MKTVYLVPHTHYDVAWAFTKEDYLQIMEIVLAKVLDLLQKKKYKFIIEQTYLLLKLEERNPELWGSLKKMIEKGRIEIVDGQYLMSDAMLPHGEVLVRNIYNGKNYCKEKFGVNVPVAWAADGFGLNSQMPQIYKKSGYNCLFNIRSFTTRRGDRRCKTEGRVYNNEPLKSNHNCWKYS